MRNDLIVANICLYFDLNNQILKLYSPETFIKFKIQKIDDLKYKLTRICNLLKN